MASNPTEQLFESYGMQSVNVAVESEESVADVVPYGNVRIRRQDLPWIAKKITNAFTTFNETTTGGGIDTDEAQILANLRLFYGSYLPAVPDEMREVHASTSNAGLLVQWMLLNWIRPDVYVESGVFIGSSLRLADITLPYATKWAYDLSFEPLLYRGAAVTYIQNDIEEQPPLIPAGKTALAFFDDHIDCVRRILLCHKLGIEWVLFDDSPAFEKLNLYRYAALPSISNILDEDMPDGAVVEWKYESSKTLSYTHDRSYCEQARKLIVGSMDVPAVFGISCGDKVLVRLKV